MSTNPTIDEMLLTLLDVRTTLAEAVDTSKHVGRDSTEIVGEMLGTAVVATAALAGVVKTLILELESVGSFNDGLKR